MEQFLSALPATLIQGLIYALISLGVYITYSILDFPDLGVDGTFPLGAAVTAVIVGSILYKTCIQAAMSMGVPANMMKLVTALLFLLVLVLSGRKGEEIIRA